MHSNMNNPDERRADTCDLPTLPMQLISLSTYPIHGPPPPYAMTPPLNPPLYSPPTVDITKTSEAYQSAIVPDDYIHLETVRIRDYMSWSLVNVILGAMIGLITVVLSLKTRQRKESGDILGARRMIFNCLFLLHYVISEQH
ncbi:unnamed protein product [Rotaria sp. Silwood1]|nr:unnamed protein product [Rotaria sp. Silwood1]